MSTKVLKNMLRTYSSMATLFFLVLAIGALISMCYLDSSTVMIAENFPKKPVQEVHHKRHVNPKTIELNIHLNCSSTDNKTCPANYYPSKILPGDENMLADDAQSPSDTCPDYFRWIHEDLWPWRETGITQEMVMNARPTANFRLVILNGKAYVESYLKSFQSRDTFTLWGILQLLRRYPGKLPDLDLMFDCVDLPVLKKDYFYKRSKTPPPIFTYCGNDSTFDIVFPDWSFWGWPEISIKPWEALSKELKEGNGRVRWTNREPQAYWKGNPFVAPTRMDLLKCNVSDTQDWNARIYSQDWFKESQQGFKQSDLASQCVHRYKIYIEGTAWSVSEKYILACDSVTLLVKPHYYDFFTRGLMPLKHYWPIKDDDKCRSIKYAVDWGNSHQEEAQEMGKAASEFVLENLKMDYVYDYMFNLLSEYAKLLTYKPTVPKNAVEICSEAMACAAQGDEKKFMFESLVKRPKFSKPCTMPSPLDPATHHSVIERRENLVKKVEGMENQYWGNRTNK